MVYNDIMRSMMAVRYKHREPQKHPVARLEPGGEQEAHGLSQVRATQ